MYIQASFNVKFAHYDDTIRCLEEQNKQILLDKANLNMVINLLLRKNQEFEKGMEQMRNQIKESIDQQGYNLKQFKYGVSDQDESSNVGISVECMENDGCDTKHLLAPDGNSNLVSNLAL